MSPSTLRFHLYLYIVGCGGLGLNLIVAAKLAQAYPICVIDIHDKADAAMQMGADSFFIASSRKFLSV